LTEIVIDTSAVMAILLREPERLSLMQRIATATSCLMSAVSLQEAAMVVAGRLGRPDFQPLDDLIVNMEVEIVSHDHALALLARDAFLRFGKGRHPARLNFGDCAAYALAKSRALPLLFKGEDFARTDIASALAAPP
jgi:ribonuclease VapC